MLHPLIYVKSLCLTVFIEIRLRGVVFFHFFPPAGLSFTQFAHHVESCIDNETEEQNTNEPDVELSHIVNWSGTFFGGLNMDGATGKVLRGAGMAFSAGSNKV